MFRHVPFRPAVRRRRVPSKAPTLGTLTFTGLVSNANAPQASTTGIAQVFDSAGDTLVVKKTFSTDSSGNASVTDVLIVAATTYKGLLTMADGKHGSFSLTAT